MNHLAVGHHLWACKGQINQPLCNKTIDVGDIPPKKKTCISIFFETGKFSKNIYVFFSESQPGISRLFQRIQGNKLRTPTQSHDKSHHNPPGASGDKRKVEKIVPIPSMQGIFYLHLVGFQGKCRYIHPTWMLWGSNFIAPHPKQSNKHLQQLFILKKVLSQVKVDETSLIF